MKAPMYGLLALGWLSVSALSGWAQPKSSGLVVELTAPASKVAVGEPLKVTVLVKNPGDHPIPVSLAATAWDSFEVLDPEGRQVPFTGRSGQLFAEDLPLPPGATYALAEDLDLMEKYLLHQPGTYRIRFAKGPFGLPASEFITVELTPGKISQPDQKVALQLVPLCPEAWHLHRYGFSTPAGPRD